MADLADKSASERRSNHAAGSLELMVENLVKNWEVEASHKLNVNEWRTVDHERYTFSCNGSKPQDASHMLKVCVSDQSPALLHADAFRAELLTVEQWHVQRRHSPQQVLWAPALGV